MKHSLSGPSWKSMLWSFETSDVEAIECTSSNSRILVSSGEKVMEKWPRSSPQKQDPKPSSWYLFASIPWCLSTWSQGPLSYTACSLGCWQGLFSEPNHLNISFFVSTSLAPLPASPPGMWAPLGKVSSHPFISQDQVHTGISAKMGSEDEWRSRSALETALLQEDAGPTTLRIISK